MVVVGLFVFHPNGARPSELAIFLLDTDVIPVLALARVGVKVVNINNVLKGRRLVEAHSTMKCNRGRGALGVRPAVSRQAEGRGECRVARGA